MQERVGLALDFLPRNGGHLARADALQAPSHFFLHAASASGSTAVSKLAIKLPANSGALAIWQRKGLLKECFCVVGHLNHYTVRYFLSASILSRPRWYQAHIHRLKLELRLIRVGSEICFRCFQPVLVIALGEVGFVMCAARFVPHARALGNHS